MSDRPRLRVAATVLDAPDPRALAGFYRALLGWEVVADWAEWVELRPPGGGAGLSFQAEPLFVAPVWPARGGAQQMMAHLDVEVADLAAAGAFAEGLGAVVAGFQPQAHVRVYLDPVGHPFCLFLPDGAG
ncbi:hypothetical protein CLV63_104172 [Murinocardiopsis flavida]|uniref:VOC domain-containing protein n=1 Tax=Murinocardiopsis flavida TaxID=645275 RepID=A0A2P8DNZ8_9ACTN|nr:VOC family protein [Murinocardiopsis flavida]PSK98948.1 hypothetical protein CLV63_104172 [Murinocardiopsis flavida]